MTFGRTAENPGTSQRDLTVFAASELRLMYASGAVSPVEAMEDLLDRLGRLDPGLSAFVTVVGERALSEARRAEELLRDQDRAATLPLLGVPVSVKDLTPTKGIRTTRGSLLRKDWVPDFDAPMVERIKRAGGIVFGKTNTSEDGWKGATGNRLVGPTRNPWRNDLTSGGSSGGAAAAVAAGIGPLATGTDGAGSIRIPAAFCGVVGLKPSFGRVPYYPISPENLSHAGPIARTVADAALMLDVIAGPDPRDPMSLDAPEGSYLEALDGPREPLRVAWAPTLGYARTDAAVERVARETVGAFEEGGYLVEEVDPPFDDPYPIVCDIMAGAEAGAFRDNFREVRDLLDPGHAEVVEHGLRLSAADLARAESDRAAFYDAARRFMEGYDLLVTPTMPAAPFDAGLDFPPGFAEDPAGWLAWTPFTYPFNLTGQPAISAPAGFADGLPIGLPIVGRWRSDAVVLKAAHLFEQARPWQDAYPPLWDRLESERSPVPTTRRSQ